MMGGLAQITGRRALRRGLVAWVAAAGALVIAAPSVLAGTDSFTFEFNETKTWTVPEGVTQVTITAVGGGGGGMAAYRGGDGAVVEVDISVAPGETFTYEPFTQTTGNNGHMRTAPDATFTVGIGGGGAACAPDKCGTHGAGGGGASIVRGTGSDLSDISLLVIAGGGGGAGAKGRGGDAGQSDGRGGAGRADFLSSINGTSTTPGLGGDGGFGGCSGETVLGNPSSRSCSTQRDFILGDDASNGRGQGGAQVGGAGSTHPATGWGGYGGAGYGGGGAGSYEFARFGDSAGGGAGGSTAQGPTVIGAATYSPFAGSGGAATTSGLPGWVRITWMLPPRPVARKNGCTSRLIGPPIILNFTVPMGLSCAAPRVDRTGSWIQVPSEGDCAITPDARFVPEVGLLGWATTPDFPVAIAQRQIDNGWGAYEMSDASGNLAAVFIPAGGWTQASSDTNLFPIWAQN